MSYILSTTPLLKTQVQTTQARRKRKLQIRYEIAVLNSTGHGFQAKNDEKLWNLPKMLLKESSN